MPIPIYHLRLPRTVYEPNLPALLKTLAIPGDQQRIVVDFEAVCYYIPAGIVAVLSRVNAWLDEDRMVEFINHQNNEAFTYLQRIDFFKQAGLELDETFDRRQPGQNFVPIEEVSPGGAVINEKISTRVAGCLCGREDPSDPIFLLTQYGIGEIVANCKQHAAGTGFVSAQYAPRTKTARFALADSGRGILASFQDEGSPHWNSGMTDAEAIAKALQENVSSKTHLPPAAYGHHYNRGIGLAMMRELTAACLGSLFIASGSSWWYRNAHNPPQKGTVTGEQKFRGTLVAASVSREQVTDYQEVRKTAMSRLNLTPPKNSGKLFK